MDLTRLRDEPIGQLIRRKLLYSLFRQSWNIGVTRHPAAVVAGLEGLRKQRQALDDLLWMEERRDAFAADPFIVRRPGAEDEYLIFYEYFPWRENRGRIDCVQFRDGKFGTTNVSLESPFHLSYPYILPHGDTLAMMPEHAESRDLSLYRFDESGVVEGKETIATDLSLLDSTIIHLNGKYWLFATHAGPNDNVELYIYHSEQVTGAWKEHALNPVKRDRANARPAGQFIHHAGELFRPAQDCASHYGSGILINRLKTLTEDAFEEEPVSELRPAMGSRYDFGLHTISSAGGYTVIDGARIESSIHPRFDCLGRYVHPNAGRR